MECETVKLNFEYVCDCARLAWFDAEKFPWIWLHVSVWISKNFRNVFSYTNIHIYHIYHVYTLTLSTWDDDIAFEMWKSPAKEPDVMAFNSDIEHMAFVCSANGEFKCVSAYVRYNTETSHCQCVRFDENRNTCHNFKYILSQNERHTVRSGERINKSKLQFSSNVMHIQKQDSARLNIFSKYFNIPFRSVHY